MNKDQFKGKWHEIKGTIKQKWGKLTDSDLSQIDGKREELLGKLQQRYGYAKERAEEELNRWESSRDSVRDSSEEIEVSDFQKNYRNREK